MLQRLFHLFLSAKPAAFIVPYNRPGIQEKHRGDCPEPAGVYEISLSIQVNRHSQAVFFDPFLHIRLLLTAGNHEHEYVIAFRPIAVNIVKEQSLLHTRWAAGFGKDDKCLFPGYIFIGKIGTLQGFKGKIRYSAVDFAANRRCG